MQPNRLNLTLLEATFAVAKLPSHATIPRWASGDPLASIAAELYCGLPRKPSGPKQITMGDVCGENGVSVVGVGSA